MHGGGGRAGSGDVAWASAEARGHDPQSERSDHAVERALGGVGGAEASVDE